MQGRREAGQVTAGSQVTAGTQGVAAEVPRQQTQTRMGRRFTEEETQDQTAESQISQNYIVLLNPAAHSRFGFSSNISFNQFGGTAPQKTAAANEKHLTHSCLLR